MTGSRLLHMGGAVVDFVYRISHLPAPGEESLASAFETLPGGGFNMMAAAAGSGMTVAYGGQHGTGPYGDLIRAALSEEGITILQTVNSSLDSGTCVVLVTADAERTFVSWPGAEGIMVPGDLASIVPRPDDWVFISGYTLSYADSGEALAAWVTAIPDGIPVVFDPSPLVGSISKDNLASLLQRANWLSCNRAEAGTIAGPGGTEAQADALMATHCPKAQGVIIRAGADGCFLKLPGRALEPVPAFAVDAVDTNGAGDTHIGAFLAELSRGAEPHEAVVYANAAAAISATRAGGSSAPDRSETKAFLRDNAHSRNRRAG
ncbi:PfkB family carbohydrate kinase [Pelagibius sp. Alg239-R121]|uniref:PfkB family carbohydrate kinase n=1 Tax=Pelagibius sp. Alg239-R121 TaxID=2993448 RepID=UPI0024A6F4DC|nr:PfkB family carbohydrate kinase [Pelagibius sp. Alg239-R121]